MSQTTLTILSWHLAIICAHILRLHSLPQSYHVAHVNIQEATLGIGTTVEASLVLEEEDGIKILLR